MAPIGETELDVRALASALWRRAWLLAFLAAAAAVATYIGLGFVDPLYTADTRILIEERESPLTRPREQAAGPASDFDESAIQSHVEVLRSREIADAVIDELDLTRRPEFDPARQTSLARSLLIMLGLRSPPTDSTIRQRVMDGYFERLTVYPLQKSRVIGVEFSAPNPKLAAEVANAVAGAFVKLQQDAKRESAVAATAWLQQEIERLRGRVAEAEQAVADYRESRGLFDVDRSGAEPGNLSTQQLGDINAELARARAARAEAEARAELVQTLLFEGGALDASEEVLNSQLIQRLRERQVALRAQVAELSTTLLPGHPRIRALQGQVANLEGQILEETGKVLASLKTAARVAAAREESLLKSLNEAKVDVSRYNDEGIELRALDREAAAQRELLESFLARYREAAARTDADYLPADARIISRAVAPNEPSFPKKTMMSLAVAIAVLLIAAAIVLLMEFISGRAFRVIGYGSASNGSVPLTAGSVETADFDSASAAPTRLEIDAEPEIEAAPAIKAEPEIEAEPEIKTEPEIWEDDFEAAPVAAVEPDRQKAESIEAAPKAEHDEESEPTAAIDMALGTELLDQTSANFLDEEVLEDEPDEEPTAADAPADGEKPSSGSLGDIIANSEIRVALFVGAEGGEGAGGIAFSAARQAAKEKLRCVVVDMGRRASDALGHERPGLCDLLAGNASFGEVIQRDEKARVHVIPLGPIGHEPPLQRMELVVGALGHTYDKVIVVADKLDDWPDQYVRPDVAAIVCGPETTESLRNQVYEVALGRGAQSAIIVRYTSDLDLGDDEESAAA